MKLIYFVLIVITMEGLNVACTKEFNSVKPTPISAFTVVNAVVNANPLIADFSGVDSVIAYYSTTQQIGYGFFHEYSLPSGNTPAVVYQITDTIHPFFKGLLNLKANAIYSLFLSAADTSQKIIDTLLVQDYLPSHSSTDSVAGVRFVNLSPGSIPMSINLQGSANGSEVNSLGYKNITSFKNYPATTNITQYVFEIRDVESGDLLTSFVYNTAPFQNVTIVISGVEGVAGGSNTIGAFLVNNF